MRGPHGARVRLNIHGRNQRRLHKNFWNDHVRTQRAARTRIYARRIRRVRRRHESRKRIQKLPDDIQATGAKAFEFLRARADANAAKAAEKATAQAAEFWKELEKKEGIEKSPTGLAIEIIEKGDAKRPSENSNVVVKYTGKLVDGTVFDSTDKHGGKPAEFNLARVIPGFREGLQKIGKGGKARLYIPAKLGYGNQALPGIPQNSTLIFDVEMVDVDPAGSAPAAAPAAK